MIDDKSTELRIIEAAKQVFIEKGFDGARMQEIADLAGINKAMLHYYFRSKDKLFFTIFDDIFSRFMPAVQKGFASDMSVEEKIKFFINSYITMLQANPYVPIFILHELTRNPDELKAHIHDKVTNNFKTFQEQMQLEINQGLIKPIDFRQIVTNIIALCVFPFVARPLLQEVFSADNESFDKLIEARKTIVPDMILNWIKM